MTGQIFHAVHPYSALNELWSSRWTGGSVAEMRLSIESQLGPFPLLFEVPEQPGHGHRGAGVVVTGLIEIPGAAEREAAGGPFLGAQAMGYVPAMGHEGAAVRVLNTVKGAAWDANMRAEPAIDPRKGTVPAETTADTL